LQFLDFKFSKLSKALVLTKLNPLISLDVKLNIKSFKYWQLNSLQVKDDFVRKEIESK
jgi:hypothetical protein